MDGVPDMDELLNELEASDSVSPVLKTADELLVSQKLLLHCAPNSFADTQEGTVPSSDDSVTSPLTSDSRDADKLSNGGTSMAGGAADQSLSVDETWEESGIDEAEGKLGENGSEEVDPQKSDHLMSVNVTELMAVTEEDAKKVADEVDRTAEQYVEMEQYLTRAVEETGTKCDAETSCKSLDLQATELKDTTVRGTDGESVGHDADIECGSRLASEADTGVKVERSDVVMQNDEECLARTDSVVDGNLVEAANVVGMSAGGHLGEKVPPEPVSAEMIGAKDGRSGEQERSDDEEGEEAELMENESDDSTGGCEIAVTEIEEARATSVVASTHDISRDPGVKYLTESERQLGRVKPVWIADKETLSCMLCCAKFTVFLRRHHCRCCGRVLCAHCTTQKAPLTFANDPNKAIVKHRVCDPCYETLKRIKEYERNLQANDADSNDRTASACGMSEGSRAAKPALKSRLKADSAAANETQCVSSSDVAGSATTKRSVTFRDGIHPGDSPVDKTGAAATSTNSSKQKKLGSKMQLSRRLKQLHISEECICLLPGADKVIGGIEAFDADDLQQPSKSNCLYLRNADGTVGEYSDIQKQTHSLRNFEPIEVMVFRNLWCTVKLSEYEGRTVLCIASRGMSFIGLDEIFVAYYCNVQSVELPVDCLWRICEIYQFALTPQNDSTDEELGIRPAHVRVPAINRTAHFVNSEKPVARDILLFRPSVQDFKSLLVPSSPFLVAVFIHHSESIWANVIPQRLLLRLGLQASFYPTPVINDFDRKPVYNPIFDTSVLKMFNDFRNWQFRMPLVCGSTLIIRDNNECLLVIPTWANDEIVKLIKANKNMIAWGLDFNADADSHLVSEQDEAGSFDSQIFTNGVGNRKLTGASFVVIDGALKGGDEPLTVSVLEDGVAVRLRSDVMESLIEALSAGRNFEQNSSAMKFSVEWNDPCARQSVGELVSPIDGRSLIGSYEYGLKKSRVLGSFYSVPSYTDWSLRLVAVYNVSRGRFAPLVQSKVFAVSEQIAAQIALTLVPFITALVEHDQRELFFRIRVSPDDAEYKAALWPGMVQEFATWTDLLDNQVAPGLFNICSYVTTGFHAELHMALISIRTNP